MNPIIEVFEEQIRKDRKRNFFASLVYEEHIRFLKEIDIGRCDAMERSFCLSDVGDFTPCIEHHNKIFSTTALKVFLEKNFDDLIEYSIILPRMFKRHERYVLNMEEDSSCSFGNFTNKVELWKKATGIM